MQFLDDVSQSEEGTLCHTAVSPIKTSFPLLIWCFTRVAPRRRHLIMVWSVVGAFEMQTQKCRFWTMWDSESRERYANLLSDSLTMCRRR